MKKSINKRWFLVFPSVFQNLYFCEHVLFPSGMGVKYNQYNCNLNRERTEFWIFRLSLH